MVQSLTVRGTNDSGKKLLHLLENDMSEKEKQFRHEECKKFSLHVFSVALSITLAQIWVGFILTRTQTAFERFGVSSPTQDVRGLLLFTAIILGVFYVFEELDIIHVPAGFGVVKYV